MYFCKASGSENDVMIGIQIFIFTSRMKGFGVEEISNLAGSQKRYAYRALFYDTFVIITTIHMFSFAHW